MSFKKSPPNSKTDHMCITRIAFQHAKTPGEVVKMENYHHLHALLSRTKIQPLEGLKKETKVS